MKIHKTERRTSMWVHKSIREAHTNYEDMHGNKASNEHSSGMEGMLMDPTLPPPPSAALKWPHTNRKDLDWASQVKITELFKTAYYKTCSCLRVHHEDYVNVESCIKNGDIFTLIIKQPSKFASPACTWNNGIRIDLFLCLYCKGRCTYKFKYLCERECIPLHHLCRKEWPIAQGTSLT